MLVLTRCLGGQVVLPELNVRWNLVGRSATAARIGISPQPLGEFCVAS
jgi:hypothetical protein